MKKEFLLEVKNLHVSIAGKEILKGINLKIKRGQTHAIFGPNGSGKTTFINAMMGFSGYKVKGKIIFRGEDITHLPINERAKRGIGISFQRPPAIRGVQLQQLIVAANKKDGKLVDKYANALNLTDFLKREVNVGFSGGEIKRAELLQLIIQDPDMIFLDEPESGVDLENIALIGEYTNDLLGRHVEPRQRKTIKEQFREKRKSGLVITHTGHILDYLEADSGHILMDGKFACEANPREMLHTLKECGFNECYRCFRKEETHEEK